MDVLNKFLQAEIISKEYYESIINFINLYERCSTKTCGDILNAVAGDKVKDNDYQNARSRKSCSKYW